MDLYSPYATSGLYNPYLYVTVLSVRTVRSRTYFFFCLFVCLFLFSVVFGFLAPEHTSVFSLLVRVIYSQLSRFRLSGKTDIAPNRTPRHPFTVYNADSCLQGHLELVPVVVQSFPSDSL